MNNTKYDINKGAKTSCRFWMVTTVLFFCLSLFLAFVALHNAKPIPCDDIIYDPKADTKVCEINL